MSKNRILIGAMLLLISSFMACKKVIQLKVNTGTPHIVIQGNIYDQMGPFSVKIFKSVNFDEPSIFPAVTGASVTIQDNFGNSDRLVEKLPGIYYTTSMIGAPGKTFTLLVESEGESYSATSTIPSPTSIGAIYFQKSLIGKNIYPVINFADRANVENYYRLIYAINQKRQPDINVTDDRLSEGLTISYLIRPTDNDIDLKSGDTVTVWLETIDRGVYEYFRTMDRQGGQSASPANPISNISNGALGYFNACSVRMLSTVVP